MNLGARRFTISTVGLIPAIRRFTQEDRQVNLAISLHAADDELRSTLLPISRKYPLDDLLAACQAYVQATGRRITFEWALIREVNDMPEQAQRLAERLQPFRRSGAALCHVNVIPLNPTRSYRGRATTRERAEAFKAILEAAGIPCTIRMRRGVDIQAGCGQLATANKRDKTSLPATLLPSTGKPATAGKPDRADRPVTGRPAPARPAPARPAPAKPAPKPGGKPRPPAQQAGAQKPGVVSKPGAARKPGTSPKTGEAPKAGASPKTGEAKKTGVAPKTGGPAVGAATAGPQKASLARPVSRPTAPDERRKT